MTRQARSRTVDEQIVMLRRLADPAVSGKMLGGCLGLIALVAAGLVVAAALRRNWGLLPFVPFLALLGFGMWHTARRLEPVLRRARYALDLGRTARGTVHVTITGEGEDVVHEARARDLGGRDWTFRFKPQGWQPAAGEHAAELRFCDEVDWPAIVLTADGIIYPSDEPKRA